MPRDVSLSYRDPLEEIWLAAARRVGWTIERSRNTYASWDGRCTLTLASAEDLDADDTLAQMILHEMCHALVAGPRGRHAVDWALDNTTDRDLVYEHATHRLQAALSDPYGLRAFMAVTTDHRGYYDALPRKPLADGVDPAIPIAQRAKTRADEEPFRGALGEALEATALLAAAVRPFSPPESLWRAARVRHRSGLLLPALEVPGSTCGDCAWLVDGAPLTCRQTEQGEEPGSVVHSADAACERYERRFDEEECGSCGACCREGFDLVPVDARDDVLRVHLDLVSSSSLGPVLLRPNGRCVALDGGLDGAPFRCRIYAERPSSCREFEVGGAPCLLARQRVGKSW
jgi:hypothetical protein